ncbi:MAG: alpha/beta fold hydrolase [Leptolyngbyaceae cyanobacterium CRU_2_3]|nr:alpha/beta fold hydrolase [Leptolyngbyaceae cyanobacterium CRU_2_3]
MSHNGRLGNTVTVNGRIPGAFWVRRGERIRLRLINVANARSFALDFAGHRPMAIAYGEAGSGQPLFLLHGLGSWSYNWRFCVEPLARSFRVICVDAKGYGFSEASTLLPEPLLEPAEHQVVELVRIIQALSDSPVIIAAESLGALTALAVAQRHPKLIERLIVINVPIFPKRLPSLGMRSLASLPLPLVQWLDQGQYIRPLAPLARQITRMIRREVVFDPKTITAEEIYWLTYPYLYLPGTLTQFAKDLRLAAQQIDRLHCQQPNLISEIQQDLAKIVCPTLILWSDQDRWFPLEDGRHLKHRLPHARFQVLPCCGHVASSNQPKAVNQAILGFCGFAQGV